MYYKLDSYVNDFSGVIKNENEFNKNFYEYEQESGIQIATVFIKHRNGRALKDIALEIFNKNGIGKKQTNSGLLLIVVTDEKKIRIMTGKGMEIEFPDSLARDIIQNELRGLLNSGKYEQLLKSWYELSTKKRRTKKIFSNYGMKSNHNKNKSGDNFVKFVVVFISSMMSFAIFKPLVDLGIMTIIQALLFIGIMFFSVFIIYSKVKNSNKRNYLILILFVFFIFLLLFIAIKNSDKFPTISNNSSYNSTWDNDSDSSRDSDSSYDSDYDSYDSYDSDWGGGSSNGGGWGD